MVTGIEGISGKLGRGRGRSSEQSRIMTSLCRRPRGLEYFHEYPKVPFTIYFSSWLKRTDKTYNYHIVLQRDDQFSVLCCR